MEERRLSEEDYRFIYQKVPRLCVDLIVKKDNKILFTKREIEPSKGKFHFPGGIVYLNERLEEAAQRIAKKEFGSEIKLKQILGAIEFFNENKSHIHSVSVVLLVEPVEKEFLLNQEASEYLFASKPPENCIEEQKEFFNRNSEKIKKVQIS